MKKNIYLIIFFIVFINKTYSQTIKELQIDSISGLVSVSKVTPVNGASKEIICKLVTDWYFERFQYGLQQKLQDGKLKLKVLTITKICDSLDKFTKKTVISITIDNVKGRSDLNFKKWKDGLDIFQINLWIKDNKYKYEVTNFSHNLFDGFSKTGNIPFEANSVNFASDKNWKLHKIDVLNQSMDLITEIEKYINEKLRKDKINSNF